MAKETRLSPRQARAAAIYTTMDKPNQVEAYKLAGFAAKHMTALTLQTTACKLFNKPHVKQRVQDILERGKQKAIERVAVSEQQVVEELKSMAFAKVGDFYEVKDGVMTLKDFDKIDTRPLSSIKQRKTTWGEDGEALTTEIKLEKFRALVKLGEYIGMFKTDEEASRAVNVYINNQLFYQVNENK